MLNVVLPALSISVLFEDKLASWEKNVVAFNCFERLKGIQAKAATYQGESWRGEGISTVLCVKGDCIRSTGEALDVLKS